MPINEITDKIITEWLNYYIKFHNYASIAIGITNGNDTYTKTFGNYHKDSRVVDNPKYSIASITKFYAVIELLKLEESGKLKISDNVKAYLAFFPNNEITIEDLLSYRVSISRDGNFNFWITEELPSDDEVVKEISNSQITRTNKFKYSNLSYAVIGLILKKFGISFQNIALTEIRGYGKKLLDGIKEYGYIDYRGFNESFGLYKNISEITDLSKQVLTKDEKLLSSESWEKLLTVYLETEGDDDDISLSLKKWKNEKVYEIHGYSFGFASSMLVDYESNYSFTVLTNSTDEEFAGYFTRTIRRLIEQLNSEKNINTESILNGFYRGKDDDIVIYDCSDSLFVYRPKQVTPFHSDNYEIFEKIGENKYMLSNKEGDAYGDEVASFEFDSEGKVIGFKQGGWGFSKVDL